MAEILELSRTYGVPLVLLLGLVLYLRPKVDEAWKLLMKRAASEEKKLEKFRENFIPHLEVNSRIKALLAQILAAMKADRVYCFSYHNGGQSIAGIDFQRMSCIHEVVSLGTRPQQPIFQNLPITLFCLFNMKVVKRTEIRCSDIQCFADEDAAILETLKAQGVKSIFAWGLYDLSGLPIGFIGVEYCKDFRDLSDQEYDELKSVADRVSTMMCLSEAAACVGVEI